MPEGIISYLAIGFIAGLIVASWHGYKDSPYEGFLPYRFLRSPIWGGVIGFIIYITLEADFVRVDNLGIVILSVICLERTWGELWKGFIKINDHPEYLPMFKKWQIPYKIYLLKFAGGLIFTTFVGGLFYYYITLPSIISQYVRDKIIIGAITGLIAGLTVAVGGAVKDSPAEGFKWQKFVRSPLVGLIGGVILVNLTEQFNLLIIAVIGFERITVEFYKTFYTKGTRGIFAHLKPKFPEWFDKRWVFFVSYSAGVAITMLYFFL